MPVQKPSIPKGTRDFLPGETVKRNYIFDTIRQVFQKYGYQPIETPAMESLDTLLGKYGEEGDRLLFRILNSGDFLKGLDRQDFTANSAGMASKISEKGLRYDLTVPFARYVVQNRNNITFPFRRYQIQPVWRADRPQKGRYREFYQCDADVIGSTSLLNEAELICMADEVFKKLGIEVQIRINSRKILSALAELIGEPDKVTGMTMAMDKLEKIGLENVAGELRDRGFGADSVAKLMPVLTMGENNPGKLKKLGSMLAGNATGMAGIGEVTYILNALGSIELKSELVLDLALARGLNYYTGIIIEVKAKKIDMGSICGGGRYDDLTGIFGLYGVSGTGISFGADRIYDVMSKSGLFPTDLEATTRVLFVNFGEKEALYCLGMISSIRALNIPAELYPDAVKLKKQLDYANSRNIPYVVLAGENEIRENKITLKEMKTGEQFLLDFAELIKKLED